VYFKRHLGATLTKNKEIKMNKLLAIYILFLITGWQCTTPPLGCQYGAPKAIFSNDQPEIKAHQFEHNGQLATEIIVFENEMELMVYQSGCDDIKQVFQFKLKGDLNELPPVFFIKQAYEQLNYMGKLSDDYLSFGQIGQIVEEKLSTIKLGESFTLQEHYFIKIDRILGKNEGILVIELSNTH